jgi:diguanylate cyclase (GGDEF)-like protein/PAS domain S-box-containing protein
MSVLVPADNELYKTLLESTRAIPWKIDWASKRFIYIGPQVHQILGWPQDSWGTFKDWSDRIHPDDRQPVVELCLRKTSAGLDHEAEYRALLKGGGSLWLREVVHVVHNSDGEVESLVGFTFDISAQKQAEAQLLESQRDLSVLSFQDGLTTLANRRMFDATLDTELAAARRSGQPLSLILIDVDYFKQFNDQYGHPRGDDCLQRIAGLLKRAAARPRDLVARFGGEEFALIVPETNSAGSLRIAQRFRDGLRIEAIAHMTSPMQVVTCSTGIVTVRSAMEMAASQMIEMADRRLYKAKQAGRDQIRSVEVPSTIPSLLDIDSGDDGYLG